MSSTRILINRAVLTHLTFVGLLVLWAAVGGIAIFALWEDVPKQPAWQDRFVATGLSATVIGIFLGIAWYYACGIAFWAEFGDQIRWRMLTGMRHANWSELGRLTVKEQKTAIPCKYKLRIVLTSGARIDLWSAGPQAEAVYELARQKPWSRDWEGAPLWPSVAAATFALGLLSTVLGAWLLALTLGFLADNAAPASANPGSVRYMRMGSTLVLLAGLAGIAFGVRHLWSRPKVIRPGVVRFREGEAADWRETLRTLLGRHE